MAASLYFSIPEVFLIELRGTDAPAVLNNLSTNSIVQLDEGQSCETFITNLRGWTVAHCIVYRTGSGLLLMGQHPAPEHIGEHIDRYVIREDVSISDVSSEIIPLLSDELLASRMTSQAEACVALPVNMIRDGWITLLPDKDLPAFRELASSLGCDSGDENEFDYRRISNFWPVLGREILEKTIPQELDRDRHAISFTKGCYLGQETIARLDARGQLQKKLCLLTLDDCGPVEAGTKLTNQDKQVGEVTSIARSQDSIVALGFVKRGSFEAGQELLCGDGTATVTQVPM